MTQHETPNTWFCSICGFRTTSEIEASAHLRDAEHKMEVVGETLAATDSPEDPVPDNDGV